MNTFTVKTFKCAFSSRPAVAGYFVPPPATVVMIPLVVTFRTR